MPWSSFRDCPAVGFHMSRKMVRTDGSTAAKSGRIRCLFHCIISIALSSATDVILLRVIHDGT